MVEERGPLHGVSPVEKAALYDLLPVMLRLTGKAAWYTPAWLRKVLPNITFAHD